MEEGKNLETKLEKKQKIEKAKKCVDAVNKARLLFMFIAIVLLLFIFWGGKVWEETEWFVNIRQKLYNFLWYDIVMMVIFTFSKLICIMRYNRLVRKM